jgi:hypothetical protein
MSTRSRAEQVMNAFGYGIQYEEDWDERNVANALREAVEGLNIEPNPDIEVSIEKHHFIKGPMRHSLFAHPFEDGGACKKLRVFYSIDKQKVQIDWKFNGRSYEVFV